MVTFEMVSYLLIRLYVFLVFDIHLRLVFSSWTCCLCKRLVIPMERKLSIQYKQVDIFQDSARKVRFAPEPR